MVLQSAHAESATLANLKWRLPTELPCIQETTPLKYKNLDGRGIHSVPVKYSTVPAKNLTNILAFNFFEQLGV